MKEHMICGVPVKEEAIREMFEGTYEEFQVKLAELSDEIYEYKMRKAINKFIFDSLTRPWYTSDIPLKDIFKENKDNPKVNILEGINKAYEETFMKNHLSSLYGSMTHKILEKKKGDYYET